MPDIDVSKVFVNETQNGPIKTLTRTSKNKMRIVMCLSISGNDYCQGEILQSIVAQCTQNYAETLFLIGDETHWHNLKSKFTLEPWEIEQLKADGNTMGTRYLEKNQAAFLNVIKLYHPNFNQDDFYKSYLINNPACKDRIVEPLNAMARHLNIPFQVIRWHEWAAPLSESAAEIEALYETVDVLKKSLDAEVKTYAATHPAKTPELQAHQDACSRDYFKTEAPAIIIGAARRGLDGIDYPGKKPKLFRVTRDYFIQPPGEIEHAHLRVQNEKHASLAKLLKFKLADTKIIATASQVSEPQVHPDEIKPVLKPDQLEAKIAECLSCGVQTSPNRNLIYSPEDNGFRSWQIRPEQSSFYQPGTSPDSVTSPYLTNYCKENDMKNDPAASEINSRQRANPSRYAQSANRCGMFNSPARPVSQSTTATDMQSDRLPPIHSSRQGSEQVRIHRSKSPVNELRQLVASKQVNKAGLEQLIRDHGRDFIQQLANEMLTLTSVDAEQRGLSLNGKY